MPKHCTTQVCCLFTGIALAALCPHVDAAAKCTDAGPPAYGPHDFYCVAVPPASSHSFCLRPDSANPRHVRQLPSYDTLLTESFVRIDGVARPAAPDPCTGVTVPAAADLARDDVVRIVKIKGKYAMQIWSSSGTPKFPAPVTLTPGKTGAGGEKFYLTTRQLGADYFVLLADDDQGQPGAADVARIEKYYDIELFPVPDPAKPTACDAARPDHMTGGTPSNFKRWRSGDTNCNRQRTQEAGNGTGGSGYP